MLPLVGRIAADIATHHGRLANMQTELRQLEAKRRTLDWPGRQRRYQIDDDIKTAQTDLRSLISELDALGVVLLEEATGLIGFPTLVNDRRAYFSWMPGEEVLGHWNYAGETERHVVPEEWAMPRQPRARAKPRRR